MTIENSVKAVQVVALDMPPPVVMEETVSVKEVLRTIQKRRSGFALLCRKGRLSGIFTERDVLNKVIGKEGVLDRPVSELMTPDPVSVHENDSIGWAVLQMHKGGFRNVRSRGGYRQECRELRPAQGYRALPGRALCPACAQPSSGSEQHARHTRGRLRIPWQTPSTKNWNLTVRRFCSAGIPGTECSSRVRSSPPRRPCSETT